VRGSILEPPGSGREGGVFDAVEEQLWPQVASAGSPVSSKVGYFLVEVFEGVLGRGGGIERACVGGGDD
jgi:hypothetical protein